MHKCTVKNLYYPTKSCPIFKKKYLSSLNLYRAERLTSSADRDKWSLCTFLGYWNIILTWHRSGNKGVCAHGERILQYFARMTAWVRYGAPVQTLSPYSPPLIFQHSRRVCAFCLPGHYPHVGSTLHTDRVCVNRFFCAVKFQLFMSIMQESSRNGSGRLREGYHWSVIYDLGLIWSSHILTLFGF